MTRCNMSYFEACIYLILRPAKITIYYVLIYKNLRLETGCFLVTMFMVIHKLDILFIAQTVLNHMDHI